VEGVPAFDLQEGLWVRKRLRVRSVDDLLGVRQSCAIYNNEAEVDATLEIVRTLARKS
jgi:selenocysteine lyase/cysteine desulfurase